MLLLRKPTVRDVPRMIELMAPGVRNEALLPRSARAVVERLRDYVVVESRGEVVGLASVSLLSEDLAEVGAVVWQDAAQLSLLLDAALDEARALGVSRAFVMAQRLARAEDELAAVVRSPTWRLLSSADRLTRGIPQQLWGRFKR